MSKLLKEKWDKLAFTKGNKSLNESEDIYPRPQHPAIANAAANTKQEMVDMIAEILYDNSDPRLEADYDACESSAEEIVAQLQKLGYC